MIKCFFVLVFLLVQNCIGGQISEEEIKYHLIDLGNSSRGATGINNKGEIIGYYFTNGYNRSFFYSRGVLRDMLPAFANNTFPFTINDKGQIVGYGSNPSTPEMNVFLFSEGSIRYLDNLTSILYQSLSINNYGQIVGTFVPRQNSYPHAFLYENENTKDLGTLGGIGSSANAINDQGQIVGNVTFDNQTYRAFLYFNGQVQDLGTLGGKKSDARALNNLGHIVGESQLIGNDQTHAFVYKNGSMQSLGTLGGNFSRAQSINDSGEMVGISKITGNATSHGFLYVGGVMRDLNDLLVAPHPDLYIYEAAAINNMGQIVGRGITPEGKFRAVLLNPLPYKKTIETIETQPTKPVYGNVLIKEDGKDSLVVVTHGRIPTGDDPNVSTAWVNTMTTAIADYLNSSNINNWQVLGYMWIEGANHFLPQTCIENAKQQGIKLGRQIVYQGYTNIHFIAHSAGAALIQSATDVIKANNSSIVVHETFLDPFVGAGFSGTSTYGKSANWTDNYSSNDHDTRNEYVPFTYNILTHAYNVDVTQLDFENRKQIPLWVTENATPCYVTRSTHNWPIQFYLNTIIGDTTSEYEGFGFGLSEIGGNWNYALSQYKVGNDSPGHTLGIPDPSDCRFSVPAPSKLTTLLNVFTAPTIQSDTGTIEKTSESSVTLSTGSPAWLLSVVTITNPINTVSFGTKFTSATGAEGLLSVLWDDQIIGTIDERVITSNSFTFRFPNAVLGSSHFLGFRLDPFTNIQSVVSITNITLQQIGVSEPFSLSFTGTTTNGVRVQELTGEPGFEYYVQSSTNLLDWVDFAVLVNTNGTVRFYDQSLTNGQTKFYRAIVP